MKHSYKHIAVIRLSALGDIINATIVLQFIKQAYPDIEIDWICEDSFAPLLETHPLINQVYTVNLKQIKKQKSLKLFIKLISKLRKLPTYDLIIDMQGLLKSSIIARIIDKNIHGYSRYSAREAIASIFYQTHSSIAYTQNIIKRNIALINDALDLHVTKKMIDNKDPLLQIYTKPDFAPQQYVVIVTGASYKNKIYPKEKLVEVCKAFSCKIYLTWGTNSEKKDASFIQAHCKNAVITPKLNLNELSALICHSSLTIGNDTGPTHLAWAYNKPSIVIFGPTNERMMYETGINLAICSDTKVDISRINKNDISIGSIPPQTIIKRAMEILKC